MFRMGSMAFTILALVACFGSTTAKCGKTVIANDFSRYSGEYKAYSLRDAEVDFPLGSARHTSDGRMAQSGLVLGSVIHGHLAGTPLMGGKEDGNRAHVGEGMMRVSHPKGGVGHDETGLLFQVRLPHPLGAATLSYKFKFDAGYDWTSGGKMPGLCDNECPTGCEEKPMHGGWAGRVHWGQDDKSRCGKMVSWNENDSESLDLEAEWHHLKIFYGMNTPETADGVQKVWLDGELVSHQTDIVFDINGSHEIEILKFDHFHGGKSNDYKPNHTQFVWFDDLAVQEGDCPPNHPPHFNPSPTNSTNPTSNYIVTKTIHTPPHVPPHSFVTSYVLPHVPPPIPAARPYTTSRKALPTLPATTFAAQSSSAVAHPTCAVKWGPCHGPALEERMPCCSPDLQCVLQNMFYAQCRPSGHSVPAGWVGTIFNYNTADRQSLYQLNRTAHITMASDDEDEINLPSIESDAAGDIDTGVHEGDLQESFAQYDADEDLYDDEEDAFPSTTCAPEWEICHSPALSQRKPCCSPELDCVVRDHYYAQCVPVGYVVPDDWEGKVLHYRIGDKESLYQLDSMSSNDKVGQDVTSALAGARAVDKRFGLDEVAVQEFFDNEAQYDDGEELFYYEAEVLPSGSLHLSKDAPLLRPYPVYPPHLRPCEDDEDEDCSDAMDENDTDSEEAYSEHLVSEDDDDEYLHSEDLGSENPEVAITSSFVAVKPTPLPDLSPANPGIKTRTRTPSEYDEYEGPAEELLEDDEDKDADEDDVDKDADEDDDKFDANSDLLPTLPSKPLPSNPLTPKPLPAQPLPTRPSNPRPFERAVTTAVAVSAPSCAAEYQRCHGTRASARRACCSPDLKCIEKDEHYGQCRPADEESVPPNWTGTILQYPSASSAAPPDHITDSPKPPPPNVKTSPSPKEPSYSPFPVTTSPKNTDSCARTYKRCGGSNNRCCNSVRDHCVKKNSRYSACRPKERSIPTSWDGTIIG